MFYLTTHSTHFIYGYMASDIILWLRTILIVRKATRCNGLCYTSCGAVAGTRNSFVTESIISICNKILSTRCVQEMPKTYCTHARIRTHAHTHILHYTHIYYNTLGVLELVGGGVGGGGCTGGLKDEGVYKILLL